VLNVTKQLNKEGNELPKWMQETARWVQRAQNPIIALNDLLGVMRRHAEDNSIKFESLSTVMARHAGIISDLDYEQANAALSAYNFAESQLTMLAAMTQMPAAFDAQIARIRMLKEELRVAFLEPGGAGAADAATGAGRRVEDDDKRTLTAKELREIDQERLAIQGRMADEALREGQAFKAAMQMKVAERSAAERRLFEEQERMMADRMRALEGVTNRSVDIIVSGFEGGFDNVIDGFRDMLAQMAKEWLKSQLVKALFSGVTGGSSKAGYLL
jgi:hypothetical protein